MSSIIKVDTIQTAAGGTPTAGDLGLNVAGSVLAVTEYKPSSVTVNTSSYADYITQAHTFTSANSKFFALLTSYTNCHDGTNYTYGLFKMDWRPSSGTTLTSNVAVLGENGSQSSDWYAGWSLSMNGNVQSTTGNFVVLGDINSGGGGTATISQPTLTIFEIAG